MFQSSSCELLSYHARTSASSYLSSMSSHLWRSFLSSWMPEAEHTLETSSSTMASILP